MKRIVLGIICLIVAFALVACGNKEQQGQNSGVNPSQTGTNVEPATDQGVNFDLLPVDESKLPIKDYADEAEKQIVATMRRQFKDSYGDDLEDAVVRVTKLYSVDDEEANEILKGKELSENEMAFEFEYDLKLSETAQTEWYTKTGNYDSATRWVTGNKGVGILEYRGSVFEIREFGDEFMDL